MKATIPLVVMAIQVAIAQGPDSATVPVPPAAATIPVETVAAPPAAAPAIESAPAPVDPSPVPVATPVAPVAATAPVVAPVAPVAAPLVVPAAVESSVDAPPSSASGEAIGSRGTWQVGFGAGMASGYGLSVRKWFGAKDGLQLNIAPYVSRTNHPEEEVTAPEGYPLDSGFVLEASVSVGLTWFHELDHYRFDDDRDMRLLSYVAGSAFLSIEQQQMNRWRPLEPGKSARSEIVYMGQDYGLSYDDYRHDERSFRLGAGAAAEMSFWKISATLGLGLGAWYESVSEDFGVAGDIQVGAHYRF